MNKVDKFKSNYHKNLICYDFLIKKYQVESF